MRVVALFFAAVCLHAQAPVPAYEPLSRAYDSLRLRDYDAAIPLFLKAAEAAPLRADIRKDLAYTYLKIGENDLARARFGEAMRLDPADSHVALEYAFLTYEAKGHQAEARRIFDRLRKEGNATAEQAFQNIDRPLAAGIERWQTAIARGGASFSAHFELATLAEQRDELELAAAHYEKAWRLLPERRSVLVDLGRIWKVLGRFDDSTAALVAASRGGQARAAELAREVLPARYPYVSEFQRALDLDPVNNELRRELAYLLLRMDRQAEAEREFQVLADTVPDDLLSATQLGFLLFARGERALAQVLFDRVLAGNDEDLANRVRAVLRLPQVLGARPQQAPASIDARVMAERSIKAGYLKDALQYLVLAHESDPGDFDIMLKLGWTLNLLRKDREAFRWFDLARRSPDPQIAAEAVRGWRSLRPVAARFRTSGWMFPIYSSRWRDLFTYAQVKTELRTRVGIRPYVSLRFVGDVRGQVGVASPQYLSESSFILGIGAVAEPWRGLTLWGEAGVAANYLTGRTQRDYRGGFSIARAVGRSFRSEAPGWFADATVVGVLLSRFGNDFLFYEQTRAGYTRGPAQFYWNANITADVQSQRWANFLETGPGMRVAAPFFPQSSFFTINFLRGTYLVHPAPFNDLRAGFWYAFSR